MPAPLHVWLRSAPPCRPGCRHVTEADFDVGGPLNHVQMDLLLWASYRGQLLARTVRWGQGRAMLRTPGGAEVYCKRGGW